MKTSQKRVAAKLFGTAAAAALLFTLPTACMNEDKDTASDDPAAVSEPASPENAPTAGKTEQAAQKTEQAATETKDITDVVPDPSAPRAVPVLTKEEADALVEEMNRERK